VASWFASWADDLVERSGLEPGWRMLDLACGTGIVARAAGTVIGPSGTVVGSDLNEGMLEEAAKHEVHGATVEWQHADATDLPFETGEFDAVLCQQGLQFIPEKAATVAEIHRVLRPGGRAWIFDGRDDFSEADQQVWFSQAPSLLKTRAALAIQRTILRTHGFTPSEWESHVPALVEQSRFGEGSIEILGIYRRLELVRRES